MKRKFLAVVELDEDILEENDSPGEYLEREFGRLEQSGIILQDGLITDDDEVRWARYTNYLIEWAFEHSGEEYEGMSPVCYDEWCDNEANWRRKDG